MFFSSPEYIILLKVVYNNLIASMGAFERLQARNDSFGMWLGIVYWFTLLFSRNTLQKSPG